MLMGFYKGNQDTKSRSGTQKDIYGLKSSNRAANS